MAATKNDSPQRRSTIAAALKQLSLSGLRVYLYCLAQKDKTKWNHIEFIEYTNDTYNNGQMVWKRGVENLLLNGFIEITDQEKKGFKFI